MATRLATIQHTGETLRRGCGRGKNGMQCDTAEYASLVYYTAISQLAFIAFAVGADNVRVHMCKWFINENERTR